MDQQNQPAERDIQTRIQKFIAGRGLKKVSFAELMEVEQWTVHAWFSGLRQMTAQQIRRFEALEAVPAGENLLLDPLLRQIEALFQKGRTLHADFIPREDGKGAIPTEDIQNAVADVLWSAVPALLRESNPTLNANLEAMLTAFSKAFDTPTLMLLIDKLSKVVHQRVSDDRLSIAEFVDRYSQKIKAPLHVALVGKYVHVTFHKSFNASDAEFQWRSVGESLGHEIPKDLKPEAEDALPALRRFYECFTRAVSSYHLAYLGFEYFRKEWNKAGYCSMTWRMEVTDPRLRPAIRKLLYHGRRFLPEGQEVFSPEDSDQN